MNLFEHFVGLAMFVFMIVQATRALFGDYTPSPNFINACALYATGGVIFLLAATCPRSNT